MTPSLAAWVHVLAPLAIVPLAAICAVVLGPGDSTPGAPPVTRISVDE